MLSQALGNALVAVIVKISNFSSTAIQFFFYAGLMALFDFLFGWIASKYQYVEDRKNKEEIN